ncbi:MAG: hypothetical protein U5L72_16920 [Bacteroidales bacterium]|nr:hypothetical protein [Bacteroidales bacterium]
MTEDIVVTIDDDASSTAIEGTHFRLDQPSITLKKSDNYPSVSRPSTILTDGVSSSPGKSPVLRSQEGMHATVLTTF